MPGKVGLLHVENMRREGQGREGHVLQGRSEG
ncbi:MAG: hypothetical protein Q9N34_05375 [Aquificota bacterium]|nr:hypothetical protein [Aquificota bacterium]